MLLVLQRTPLKVFMKLVKSWHVLIHMAEDAALILVNWLQQVQEFTIKPKQQVALFLSWTLSHK